MVTRVLFSALVLLVATQRLVELRLSGQNERALRAHGAQEHAPEQMRWMRLIHAAWLVAMLLEVWVLERSFDLGLAAAALAVLTVGQVLRLTAIRTLGPRWSVKVLTLPHTPPVTTGIYRFVRHPNYLGVVLEIAALPLFHGAYLTAAVFTVVNGALLWRRIHAEEDALAMGATLPPAHGGAP